MVLSPDTHPEIERVQIDRLRQMPPWRKVQLAAEMGRAVRRLALAGLRQRHPDDTPAQRRRRLASLMLGDERAARIYGPMQVDRPGPEGQRGSKNRSLSPSGR
jgi:hypothetical protein